MKRKISSAATLQWDQSSYNIQEVAEGSEMLEDDSSATAHLDALLREKKKKTRGPTLCTDVWTMPEGQKITITVNKHAQPIRYNGKKLADFLGTLARNNELTPLNYNDWRKIPSDTKSEHWDIVQSKFEIPACCKKWVLQSLAKKWRSYKSELKANFYVGKDFHSALQNRPEDIQKLHWEWLVRDWKSDDGKIRSAKNKDNRSKVKFVHIGGSKSQARLRDEMPRSRPSKSEPSKAEVFVKIHKRNDNTFVNEETEKTVGQLEALAIQEGDTLNFDNITDAQFADIVGEDKNGYAKTYGLGVKPTQLGERDNEMTFNDVEKSASAELIVEMQEKMYSQAELMKKMQDKINGQTELIVKMQDKFSGLGQLQATMRTLVSLIPENLQSNVGPTRAPTILDGSNQMTTQYPSIDELEEDNNNMSNNHCQVCPTIVSTSRPSTRLNGTKRVTMRNPSLEEPQETDNNEFSKHNHLLSTSIPISRRFTLPQITKKSRNELKKDGRNELNYEEMSDYEKQRFHTIKENSARMQALGLNNIASKLMVSTGKQNKRREKENMIYKEDYLCKPFEGDKDPDYEIGEDKE